VNSEKNKKGMTKHETLSKSKGAGTRQVRSFVVGCVGRGKTCISALVYVRNMLGAIVPVFPKRTQQQCLGATILKSFMSRRSRDAVETTILGARFYPLSLMIQSPGQGQPLALVAWLHGGLLGGPFEGTRVLPRNDESSGRASSTFLR
jgi:hypothetical protein